MSGVEIRPARASDFEAFGRPLPVTARAVAAVRGDEVLGIGGVAFAGGFMLAFSDQREDLGRKDRVRGLRAIMGLIRTIHAPVYAQADNDGQAARLLKRLGFEPVDGSDYYLWREPWRG